MNYNHEMHNNYFNPDLIKEKLILISIFIAIYENFKLDIVDKLQGFYWSGFVNGSNIYKDYENEVLKKVVSNKNKTIKATLLWFKEAGAIDDTDIKKFKEITDMRNEITHNMIEKLSEIINDETNKILLEMLQLYEKITKWWIKEIEIPINPEITQEMYGDIKWNEITSVSLEYIRMMTDIAINGNKEYFDLYNDIYKKNKEKA